MKPPRRPSEQAWSSSDGSSSTRRIDEARDRVRRELLEDAQVDEHPDDRLARPVVRAAQDARLEDAQASARGPRSRRGGGAASTRAWMRSGSRSSGASVMVSRRPAGPLDALRRRQRVQRRRRDALAPPQVEAVARRQRVQDDVADHHRPVAADLPGVVSDVGAVDDRDAAPPDHLHDAVRADHAGRVLVDAEPEQATGSGR